MGSRKSILGPKRPISESYDLNLAILGLFRLGEPLDGLFSWSMSWEMWPTADLKHVNNQKKIYFGALESQFGVQKGQFLRAMS